MFYKTSGIQKTYGYEGRREGVSRFSVEKFCLTVPKNFVGERFSVPLKSGTKTFMPKRGKSRFSTEKMLSHSTPKTSYGNTSVFYKTFGIQKTYG